jgi:hypothetical protein
LKATQHSAGSHHSPSRSPDLGSSRFFLGFEAFGVVMRFSCPIELLANGPFSVTTGAPNKQKRAREKVSHPRVFIVANAKINKIDSVVPSSWRAPPQIGGRIGIAKPLCGFTASGSSATSTLSRFDSLDVSVGQSLRSGREALFVFPRHFRDSVSLFFCFCLTGGCLRQASPWRQTKLHAHEWEGGTTQIHLSEEKFRERTAQWWCFFGFGAGFAFFAFGFDFGFDAPIAGTGTHGAGVGMQGTGVTDTHGAGVAKIGGTGVMHSGAGVSATHGTGVSDTHGAGVARIGGTGVMQGGAGVSATHGTGVGAGVHGIGV